MLLSKALIVAVALFFLGIGLSLIPKVESIAPLNAVIQTEAKLRAPLMKWLHATLPVQFDGFDAAPWIYITTLFLLLVAVEFYRDRNFEQREVLTMKRKSDIEKQKEIKLKLEKQKKLKAELARLEKEAAAREAEQSQAKKEQEDLHAAQREAIAAAQRASQERVAKEKAQREAEEAERRAAETAKHEAQARRKAEDAAKKEAEAKARQSADAEKKALEAAKREAEEIKRKAAESAETAKREAEEAERRAAAAKRDAEESERRALEAKKSEAAAENKRLEAEEARKKEEEEKTTLAEATANKREELMELLAQTKKSLDEQKRELAFLAMDVVNSTGMKQGEDPAIAARDFKQYKKHVMAALQKHNYLKLAWTPDGQMICFDTIEDAVRAGQSVLNGLEDFNKNVKAMKMDFRIRAGINAGRVLYDEDVPMEEMSDRVIDITGHMQKYAAADTIFINAAAIGDKSKEFGFSPVEKVVDDCKVLCWKSPSAEDDPKTEAVAA
jgi:DNA segregation ATPase FtsK/SpoIIIE-like protein